MSELGKTAGKKKKSTDNPQGKRAGKPPRWANRIVGHADVLASSLTPHPQNPRIHPATQRAAVSEALTRLGWIESVVVNKTTGKILNGHLRVELAAARGETVPVDYVQLSEADERIALASIDPLAALAVEDPEKIGELLSGMNLGSSALDTLLMTTGEDAQLTALLEEDGSQGPNLSPKRRIPNATPNIALVIPIKSLAIVERAIRATGKMNRGEGVEQICRSYLEGQQDFIA